MKREDLFKAIGDVDEDLLDEDVAPAEPAIWRYVAGITTAAACIAVILGTAGWAKLHQQRPPVQTSPDVTTESDTASTEETGETPEMTEQPTAAAVLVTTISSDAAETASSQTETQETTAVSTSTSEHVETSAASETASPTEPAEVPGWKPAYRSVAENAEFNNDFTKEQLKYALTDIDGDGTPELIVNVQGYLMFMYTWADGETYTLMDGWPYGAGGNAGYEWIPGENKLYNHNSDCAGLLVNNWFFHIGADHQLVDDAMVTVVYFNDINGNCTLDEDAGEVWEMDEANTTYYLNNEPITAEEAHTYLDTLGEYTQLAPGDNGLSYDQLMAALQ